MSLTNSPFDNQDVGPTGEAVTAALISDVLGGDLVYQHTPGEPPQGIDISYLNDDGELNVSEVKSVIGDWHQPATALTVDGRQMDSAWVADRLERTGVEIDPAAVGDASDQVHTELFQVDFVGDTIARYGVDFDGRRAENSPSEIYTISDVLDVHEGVSIPEADAASLDRGPNESESTRET